MSDKDDRSTVITVRSMKTTGFSKATARLHVAPDVWITVQRDGCATDIDAYRRIREDVAYYRRKWNEAMA